MTYNSLLRVIVCLGGEEETAGLDTAATHNCIRPYMVPWSVNVEKLALETNPSAGHCNMRIIGRVNMKFTLALLKTLCTALIAPQLRELVLLGLPWLHEKQ